MPGRSLLHIPGLSCSRLVINLSPLREHSLRVDSRVIRSGPTAPGGIRIAPADEECVARVDGPMCRFLQVYWSDETMRAVADEFGTRWPSPPTLTDPLFHFVDPVLLQIGATLTRTDLPALDQDGAASTFWMHLLGNYSKRPGRMLRVRAPENRWRTIIAYLHDRLAEDISLREAAAVAGLGVHQFGRAFRDRFGTTPWQYLQQIRMARARELLQQSNLTLAEIAFQSGYQTQSRFGQVFRRTVGVTPAEYRRLVRR
jgi:AraC-like DNA-binding protein